MNKSERKAFFGIEPRPITQEEAEMSSAVDLVVADAKFPIISKSNLAKMIKKAARFCLDQNLGADDRRDELVSICLPILTHKNRGDKDFEEFIDECERAITKYIDESNNRKHIEEKNKS